MVTRIRRNTQISLRYNSKTNKTKCILYMGAQHEKHDKAYAHAQEHVCFDTKEKGGNNGLEELTAM